jgi:hypothetical protein
VGRSPGDGDPEVRHPAAGDPDVRHVERLGDHGGVRPVAAFERRADATDAAVLLLDGRPEDQVAREVDAHRPECPDGGQGGGDAALHVGGPAAVQGVAVADEPPRAGRPLVRVRRDDVDVAAQGQRPPLAFALALQNRGDVRPALVADLDERGGLEERLVPAERLGIGLPDVRVGTEPLERLDSDVLCGRLLAGHRPRGDQVGEQFESAPPPAPRWRRRPSRGSSPRRPPYLPSSRTGRSSSPEVAVSRCCRRMPVTRE